MTINKAQTILDFLKNILPTTDSKTIILNNKRYDFNKDFFLETIQDKCVSFLNEKNIFDIDISESRYYMIDNFEEEYNEIEESATDWLINDILENLGLENDKLESICFE